MGNISIITGTLKMAESKGKRRLTSISLSFISLHLFISFRLNRLFYEWASWTKTEKKREISFNHWW